MKKNKIIIYLFLIAQLFALESCTDWLNLTPADGVPRQEYWKTKEDVNAAVVGVYSSMLSSDLIVRMFLYGEWRADMIKSGTRKPQTNVVRAIEGEFSDDNSLCSWGPFYKTINLCNTILKYAPEARENDPSFTDKLYKEYEAQAIAARSLMYFYLVRSFGDVPLTFTAYVDNSQSLSIAKTNGDVILDSLINNLKYVEKNIPYSYGSTARDKGKITAWTVKALLADIYLWKEQYAECNKLCDEIIKSGQFALVPVGRERVVKEGLSVELNDTLYYPNDAEASRLFTQMYYNGNCVESLFELQFSNEIRNPFYEWTHTASAYVVANTAILSDEIYIPTEKDDRGYYDIRESIVANKGYIWKYSGRERNGAERAMDEFTGNYIIYRLAEIYLMKAEALTQMGIESGNDDYLTEAREALEKVRVRANAVEATDLTYKAIEYSGKTMEEFVLQERAREMAYEGKRWFDVLRQAKRNNYAGNNIEYLMRLAISSAPPEKVFSLQAKYKNHKSHYLPIVKSELEANPLLKQNDFYATTSKK